MPPTCWPTCRGKPVDLLGQVHQVRPHRPLGLALELGQRRQLAPHRAGHAAFGQPRQLVDGRRRQPEHLAQVAHRAAQVIRRERAHQRGVLVAVALVHLQDQLLANVARKIEIDIRHRLQVFVEKAAEEEPVEHRVHVAETDQVADDRADRRAAAAAGRQARAAANGAHAAHALGDLGRLLLQIAIDQKEAGQLVLFRPAAARRPAGAGLWRAGRRRSDRAGSVRRICARRTRPGPRRLRTCCSPSLRVKSGKS